MNKKIQGEFIIKSEIPEQEFIESLLNMKYSGVSEEYLIFCLGLHSLGDSWEYDKVLYYLKLLELLKTTKNNYFSILKNEN